MKRNDGKIAAVYLEKQVLKTRIRRLFPKNDTPGC